jgi:hypothetical protein
MNSKGTEINPAHVDLQYECMVRSANAVDLRFSKILPGHYIILGFIGSLFNGGIPGIA